VQATLKQQFQNWLFRPKTDSGTVKLTQRRIFIVPTRQGAGLVLVLLIMLLGDVNYNLSLGYALTFLFGTIALMAMIYTFRNMAQLEVSTGRAEPVFAGNDAQFVFHFHNRGKQDRHQLTLRDEAGHHVTFDIPAQQNAEVRLSLPATKRGWLATDRLTLFTEFPLGFYHAWSYLQFDTRCLVYPRPAPRQPLPQSSLQGNAGTHNAAGEDDFAGLRNYVAGDASARIAWKALAREQGLQVKQFSAQAGQELWLDWTSLSNHSPEHRLEVLTRWVLDADTQGLIYGLRLPDATLPLAQGAAHRAECLRALALYGPATPPPRP
jgi:uncharacterized protein (DUF58 family)